jgi:DNA-binding CsgD family transcriptional regulator
LASVALCLEPVGERRWDRSIAEWCREALSAATPDGATRARLLARLAHALVYTADYDAAGGHAVDAQNEAEASGDADALVAALRARQMTSTDPDRSDDRAELAARMTALGEQLRRPDVEMWGRLWALDVMWERGDLVGVAAEISRLHWCVEHVGTSIARWHLLVAEAALAQAQGEFDEALANARAGFELMLAMGHPAAIGAFMSLATTVGHHRGQDETTTRVAPSGVPGDTGEVRNELFAFIGPASALADAGRLDEALAAYQRPGPPQQWRIPPYFYLQALHTGASLAVTLDITDDIAWFRDQLEPHRGRHVAGGAGGANYYGPIELILGRCAAALGELDRAAADLDNARATCARIGAVGFEIEATVELASVLRRQGQDRAAHALLTRARPRALRLGMKPWIERIDRGLADSADDPLTPREREVAGLVAQGKSNKEIASTLVLSERTAANHVQHILTKLGFANRSQIAAWASTNASSE